MNNSMKRRIAVYAICKDELQFVDKWMESMLEADAVCVLDTGSTDGTWERLNYWKEKYPDKIFLGQKTFNPWRFDVPRNESMKLIPDGMDMWWCTDLDELAVPGWANAFRSQWDDSCGKMIYKYAWSHNSDGSPGRVFWYDKLTSADRRWRWVHPVHEQLSLGEADEWYKTSELDGNTIYLHHYPVTKDSRGSYLPLLEMRCKETPNDFYGHIYLSHEYLYQNQPQNCFDYIQKVTLPMACKTIIEQGRDNLITIGDLYMFMGRAKLALNEIDEALEYFLQGVKIAPHFRENYLYAAKIYLDYKKDYVGAIHMVNDCFLRSRRYYSWLELDNSWKEEPWDILTLAYWNIGCTHISLQCAKIAALEDPNNTRLQDNIKIIEHSLEK